MELIDILALVFMSTLPPIYIIFIFHARFKLPKSHYSLLMQILFLFCLVTTVFSVTMSSLLHTSLNIFITSWISGITSTSKLFTIGSASTFSFAQAEYLKSIAPYDERLSKKLFQWIRVVLFINVCVGILSSFSSFLNNSVSHISYTVNSIVVGMFGLFGICVDSYLFYFLLIKLRSVKRGYKWMYIGLCILALCFYIPCMILLNQGGSPLHPLDMIGTSFAGYVVNCSYLSMLTVRFALESRQSRKRPRSFHSRRNSYHKNRQSSLQPQSNHVKNQQSLKPSTALSKNQQGLKPVVKSNEVLSMVEPSPPQNSMCE